MKRCDINARMARGAARCARMESVNEWLLVLASTGRQFLSSGERHSYFEMSLGTAVFVDHFSRKRLRPRRGWFGRGFTDGGTMNQLCVKLQKFIMHGQRLKAWEIGPAERWGYPARDIDTLVGVGLAHGILETG